MSTDLFRLGGLFTFTDHAIISKELFYYSAKNCLFLYTRLFENLKGRILKSIITWLKWGNKPPGRKRVFFVLLRIISQLQVKKRTSQLFSVWIGLSSKQSQVIVLNHSVFSFWCLLTHVVQKAQLNNSCACLLLNQVTTELKNVCACVTFDPLGVTFGAKISTWTTHSEWNSWLRGKISVSFQVCVQEICLSTLTGRTFAKVWSLSGLPNSYLR